MTERTQSFKVYNTEYEGSRPEYFFSHVSDYSYGQATTVRYLKKWLEDGGQVFLELTEGARKGSVGRLVISPADCDAMYRVCTGGWYKGKWIMDRGPFVLEFDDHTSKIKIEQNDYRGMAWPKGSRLRFNAPKTVWVYTTKPKPKTTTWVPRDHFGTEITKETLVMFTDRVGTTRFGYPERWSEKGMMWMNPVRTRKNISTEQIHTGVMAHNMVVCGKDLAAQVTLAKLTIRD